MAVTLDEYDGGADAGHHIPQPHRLARVLLVLRSQAPPGLRGYTGAVSARGADDGSVFGSSGSPRDARPRPLRTSSIKRKIYDDANSGLLPYLDHRL